MAIGVPLIKILPSACFEVKLTEAIDWAWGLPTAQHPTTNSPFFPCETYNKIAARDMTLFPSGSYAFFHAAAVVDDGLISQYYARYHTESRYGRYCIGYWGRYGYYVVQSFRRVGNQQRTARRVHIIVLYPSWPGFLLGKRCYCCWPYAPRSTRRAVASLSVYSVNCPQQHLVIQYWSSTRYDWNSGLFRRIGRREPRLFIKHCHHHQLNQGSISTLSLARVVAAWSCLHFWNLEPHILLNFFLWCTVQYFLLSVIIYRTQQGGPVLCSMSNQKLVIPQRLCRQGLAENYQAGYMIIRCDSCSLKLSWKGFEFQFHCRASTSKMKFLLLLGEK